MAKTIGKTDRSVLTKVTCYKDILYASFENLKNVFKAFSNLMHDSFRQINL